VVNKIDNESQENLTTDFASLGFSHSQSVSAEHNRGISELLKGLGRLLPLQPEISHKISTVNYQPVAIAIVGRPNVGKSSLINSIVNSERAIVNELPGTTRDAVDIFYQRDGQQYLFIDTAGIRRRGRHSTSAEVFSVMRAERSIRRADLCVLIVDLTIGVTAQDKRIAGLIQQARKAAIIVLNKWDLIKQRRRQKQMVAHLVGETRSRLFFLDYAPVLVASALTGENIDRLFALIANAQHAAKQRTGTGVLNRLLRAAFAANPPAMVSGKRLKLFYAAQARHGTSPPDRRTSGKLAAGRVRPIGGQDQRLLPPEFVLFVNDPRLLSQAYRRYLESCIRKAQPFPGLPITLKLRPRTKDVAPARRLRAK
jgi:GTP-binding protein